jgi:spore coat protein U-like protein
MRIVAVALLVFLVTGVASIAVSGDSGVLTVSATVISKGNCRFSSKTSSLDFGSLDPGSPDDKSKSTTIVFRCQATGNNLISFSVTDNDGMYRKGPDAPRMKRTGATSNEDSEYLPYTLVYTPSSGSVPKVTDQDLLVTGTLRSVDYQNAYAGSYSDTVVISIVP